MTKNAKAESEKNLADTNDLATSIPEVTLKNKKSEILDALHAALAREKKRTAQHYEPEVEERHKQAEAAVSETHKNVQQNIFSDELNQKFTKLELAISAEETKLQNLYSIEKELRDLTLIINAKNSFIANLEEEKERERRALECKIEELENEHKAKTDALEKSFAERKIELEKAQTREQEEYEYKIKRDRAAENDAWEDSKKAREAELAAKERAVDELLKEAEADKKHTQNLEERIEKLPEELKAEYERGYADASKELGREQQYAESLLKKDFQNTIDRQADKIKALESSIGQYVSERKMLQEKLDRAYAEIKEMATKTVESTGGVKILGAERPEV